MKHEISVITVMLNGRKRFVKLGDKRDDQRFTMEYTDNAEDATEFDDKADASWHIKFIHNPYERVLNVESVVIVLKPILPIKSGSFK